MELVKTFLTEVILTLLALQHTGSFFTLVTHDNRGRNATGIVPYLQSFDLSEVLDRLYQVSHKQGQIVLLGMICFEAKFENSHEKEIARGINVGYVREHV
jgi:hypothetical protein